MRYLLGLLVFLVIADGVLTEFLLWRGIASEGNPLLQPLVGNVGFIVLKVVGAGLCALILWDIHRRYRRIALVSTSFFITAYGVIVLWNLSLALL